MEGVGTILVLDRSATGRETLRTLLMPHCRRAIPAATLAEGLDHVTADDSIGLVLCDAVLPERGAFRLLDRVKEMPAKRPHVILISPWWIPADAERAAQSGALGYITRPISLRDIARLWKSAISDAPSHQPRTQRRPLAKVWQLEGGEQDRYLMSWDLYDVSATGAFIETRGPLRVGAVLELEIIFGKQVVRTRAEVMRVQEPSWMHVGGVGVRFIELDAEGQRLIEDFVNQSVVVSDH